MSIDRDRRLLGMILLAVAVCACNRTPATSTHEYAAGAGAATGGLVGPLKDDTSDAIVS